MKDKDNNETRSKERVGKNFQNILTIKGVTLCEFGKILKSSIDLPKNY